MKDYIKYGKIMEASHNKFDYPIILVYLIIFLVLLGISVLICWCCCDCKGRCCSCCNDKDKEKDSTDSDEEEPLQNKKWFYFQIKFFISLITMLFMLYIRKDGRNNKMIFFNYLSLYIYIRYMFYFWISLF